MDEIEFTADGITLREFIEVFGESRKEKRTIGYEDRARYSLHLDTGGFVSLEELVDVTYNDDGIIKSVSLQLENLPSIEAAIRTREQGEAESSLPDVPHVDMDDINIDARKNFYRRLKERPDSQPATIREIIFSEGELSRQEFNRLVKEAGYEPSGGGVSASLVVLEEITNEIERRGRGDDTRIIWTGNQ